MLGEVGLADERAASRIEADGEQVEHHLVGQPAQLGAVVDRGQRVQVDDAVDRLVLVLQRHVVHLGAEVVAEVRRAGGLDPAEDALPHRAFGGARSVEGLAHGTSECTPRVVTIRPGRGYGSPMHRAAASATASSAMPASARPTTAPASSCRRPMATGRSSSPTSRRPAAAAVAAPGRRRRGATCTSSVALVPDLAAADAWRLGLATALAVADACATVAPVALKWPNDVVAAADGRKLGGLLIETMAEADRLRGAVLGIGINVNWLRAEMPAELRDHATSLADLAGEPVDREALLASLLDALEAEITAIEDGASPLERYRARCSTLGSTVEVEAPRAALTGRAIDLDPTGALVVEDGDGRRHASAAARWRASARRCRREHRATATRAAARRAGPRSRRRPSPRSATARPSARSTAATSTASTATASTCSATTTTRRTSPSAPSSPRWPPSTATVTRARPSVPGCSGSRTTSWPTRSARGSASAPTSLDAVPEPLAHADPAGAAQPRGGGPRTAARARPAARRPPPGRRAALRRRPLGARDRRGPRPERGRRPGPPAPRPAPARGDDRRRRPRPDCNVSRFPVLAEA